MFQKERSTSWEVVLSVIVRKKFHMNMWMIVNVDSARKNFFTHLVELWVVTERIL
jgi:hypothetical protein